MNLSKIIVGAAAVLTVAGCGSTDWSEVLPSEVSSVETKLRSAYDSCSFETPADFSSDDRIITIRNIEGSGEYTPIDDALCLLIELNITDDVLFKMERTNALAGLQEGSWDNFTASWTYHPDDGMNLVVKEN